MSPSTTTRWCPTPEQVMILEELYRRGVKTPKAAQIQKITAHLSFYGKIQGKNVFYWFQNHKARDRQKLRKRIARQQQQLHQLHLLQLHLNQHQLLDPQTTRFPHLLHESSPPFVPFHHQLPHGCSSPETLLPQGVTAISADQAPAGVMMPSWREADNNIPTVGDDDCLMMRRMINGHDSSMIMDVGPTFMQHKQPLQTLELFPLRSSYATETIN